MDSPAEDAPPRCSHTGSQHLSRSRKYHFGLVVLEIVAMLMWASGIEALLVLSAH